MQGSLKQESYPDFLATVELISRHIVGQFEKKGSRKTFKDRNGGGIVFEKPDAFWRTASFEVGASEFISAEVILKSDGELLFTVELKFDF